MEEQKCQYAFTDRNKNVIACSVHPNEREILPPSKRRQILTRLVDDGKWGGQDLMGETVVLVNPQREEVPLSDTTEAPKQEVARHVALRPAASSTLPAPRAVSYDTFDGQKVELTVQAFQSLICPAATQDQAFFMLQWAAHNKLDPFAGEAWFAVIDGKPSLQVSKDAWLRRVEAHPRFVSHDGGIIVETSLQNIKESILGGMDDYLIAPQLKEKLMADFMDGKALEPKGIAARIKVMKRGIFHDPKDQLLGGWAEITVKDRPRPYRFEIDKEGWQTTTGQGQENVFWRRKAPFMAWKSALKNCCRQAFPELSGLMRVPDKETDFDPAAAADVELTQRCTTAQLRALHASARHVPLPVGPLNHDALHQIAVSNYDGRGLSELTLFEMSALIDTIEQAVGGNQEILQAIARDLAQEEPPHGSTEILDSAALESIDNNGPVA